MSHVSRGRPRCWDTPPAVRNFLGTSLDVLRGAEAPLNLAPRGQVIAVRFLSDPRTLAGALEATHQKQRIVVKEPPQRLPGRGGFQRNRPAVRLRAEIQGLQALISTTPNQEHTSTFRNRLL